MPSWNRQRFIKDPNTGKRVSRPNPDAKWIRTEVPELRVVDVELWRKPLRNCLPIRATAPRIYRCSTAS
jgi:hypothetical protein